MLPLQSCFYLWMQTVDLLYVVLSIIVLRCFTNVLPFLLFRTFSQKRAAIERDYAQVSKSLCRLFHATTDAR